MTNRYRSASTWAFGKFRWLQLFVGTGLVLCPLLVARADGSVKSGPMGQGEAAIQVRSDVQLAIKGAGGTPRERVEALAAVVSGELSGLRRCYRERVAVDPRVVGSYRVEIELEPGRGPASLQIEEREGSDGALRNCLQRNLARADYSTVERPALAKVTLRFENSRASGQQALTRNSESSGFAVTADGGGSYRGSWADPGRRVEFAVVGHSDDVVVSLLGVLRDRFASFLDCRRRAEKGGRSPAGEMEFQVAAALGGALRPELASSSVASDRAPKCASQALSRSHCQGCGSKRLALTVVFGE